MATAILSALEPELERYRETCTITARHQRAGLTIFEATYRGHNLVLVQTGVGKVNAALCTQLVIDAFEAETVICTGSAGALRPDLSIGDVVVAEDCVQHDVQVGFLGLPRGQIPFTNHRFFSADPTLVARAQEVELSERALIVGRVCTGDTFIEDEAARDAIRDELDGDCVEMEGAAVGHVCCLNDVPFLLVRAISDRADGSSDLDFQSFLKTAARTSARIVLRLLEKADPDGP